MRRSIRGFYNVRLINLDSPYELSQITYDKYVDFLEKKFIK